MENLDKEKISLKNSFERLVLNLSKLPAIGNKTASRLAAYIIKSEKNFCEELSESIISARNNITFCKICGCYAESELCVFCENGGRDTSVICVVEEPLDVWPIEKTGCFRGLFHILMGVISINKGVSPGDLNITSLLKRIRDNKIKELIFAMNPTLDGESTSLYLKKKIFEIAPDLKISRLAMGLPAGSLLEYADRETLSKSLNNRVNL